MGWRDLLGSPSQAVYPWLGGRQIYGQSRAYKIDGELPREFGWYLFACDAGRRVKLLSPADPDPTYFETLHAAQGYLVGNRFVPATARVDPDPTKLVDQTVPIYLVEEGLDRFPLVQASFDSANRLIYSMQLLPGPADDEARWAFVERKESLDHVKGVTPALDLAFRFAFRQRQLLEERREALRKQREEEARKAEVLRKVGSGQGRRTLAQEDLEAAVKAALQVGGAEFLDVRRGYSQNEIVVQYRFENRRLECVCDRRTFRIIDSGICLEDHRTREKGDTYFTLESLPGVVREAINAGKLVVYRHADGADWRNEPDDDWEDD